MDAIDLLKADHRKFRKLFRTYEAAGDRAHQKKRDLADKLFMEVIIHSMVEEELFYPAVKEQADKEGKRLVAEMKALDHKDERFEAKFSVLRESIEHHIEEEENELFPEAEEFLGARIKDLGAQMEERKDELMASRA
jgi:hemerythrin-like domain-containing protein